MTTKTKPLIRVTSGPRNARTDPESGLRFYTWEGVEYPSVTSIRNLAGMPHPLANWRTNQVIEKAMTQYADLGKMLASEGDPKAVAAWLRAAMNAKRDAAADLGKRVHDAAANGTALDKVGADVGPFLIQYKRWLSHTGIEVLLVERQCWNEGIGYAGTFDLIGRFKRTGKIVMIDLKTGSGTYPEHALQLEAYANGEFIGEDDVIDGDATDLLQQVELRAVLHLRADGWTMKFIPASERTWIAFRGLLAFARWQFENPVLDGLIDRVVEGPKV